jgi:hypothetical protein
MKPSPGPTLRLSACSWPVTRWRSQRAAVGGVVEFAASERLLHFFRHDLRLDRHVGLVTPIMRRVCCTTSLNTGAATSPP